MFFFFWVTYEQGTWYQGLQAKASFSNSFLRQHKDRIRIVCLKRQVHAKLQPGRARYEVRVAIFCCFRPKKIAKGGVGRLELTPDVNTLLLRDFVFGYVFDVFVSRSWLLFCVKPSMFD